MIFLFPLDDAVRFLVIWDQVAVPVRSGNYLVLLVGMLLPLVFDRAKAAWGVVGGKLADFGWWMREGVPAA